MPTQGPAVAQGRNPRALIKVNDFIVRKIDSLEYVENNYSQPDSFKCKLPLYDLHPEINADYWLSQPALLIEIFIGFPNDPINYGIGDLQSMVLGGINDLIVCPFGPGGGYVEFNGFDLTKSFIDNKTTEKFPNLKASDIVTQLAVKRGLTPVVTKTTTEAGIYYNQDFVQPGSEVTEWDLITYLAQREGFQVFVRGTSLYFQPRVTTSPTPYVFQAQTLENGQSASFNGSELTLSRNLNYARDVIVTVSSWNAKTGYVSAQAKGTKNKQIVAARVAQSLSQPQTFEYYIPGLSKQQALQRAQQMAEDISQHERVFRTTCPGDNILRKDSLIQVKGVCPSADQTYYPDTITRTVGAGYIMNVVAKNHSPQSIVSL